MSQIGSFDRALRCWRSLHDVQDRLQRAAFERGIETWRWVVLLDPWAGPQVCIAALFANAPQTAGALAHLDLDEGELDDVLRLIARDPSEQLRAERALLDAAVRHAEDATALRDGTAPPLAKVSGIFVRRDAANDRQRDGTG